MKRGCFLSLLTWAACAAVYWYFCETRLVGNVRWVLPLFAGLIMAVVIGTLRSAIANALDAMRLSRASEPGTFGERPRDGALVSVSGHIRTNGPPLRAPLSGRPAVLYNYEISHTHEFRDSAPSEVTDWSGYGLAPAVIDSRFGPIRLLGFPLLDSIDRQQVERPNVDDIRKYVEETQFKDMSGFHPSVAYREMTNLLSGDEGHLKKDWRMAGAPKPEPVEADDEPDDSDDALQLGSKNFFEKVIAPGEQVSAIGRYSAAQSGLVPDMAHPLRLLRGDASVAAGKIRGKVATQTIGAIVFGALLNGIVFGILKLQNPGPPIAIHPATIAQDAQEMVEAARKGNVATLEKFVKGGMPADACASGCTTPLMVAANANTAGWLIAHGANVDAKDEHGQTPLMLQSQYGTPDVVQLLIRSGAKLNAKSAEYKMSALQMALSAEKLDNARALRDAGANDDTITEKNGTPVADDSEPVRVCREYIDAVQREDRASLGKLSMMGSFSDVDFKLWKKIRFANGRLVSGYATDDAATIVMRGATPGGTYVTYTYQLVRQIDGWKLTGERWETRLDGRAP